MVSRQYRQPKPLPLELAQHVQIYFEEELYSQSLTLLLSLITSPATHPEPSQSPAIAPPPSYLALAATLSLHPLTTTRTKSPFSERHEASLLAAKLLRYTFKVFGPINGDFAKAFEFKHFEGAHTRLGRGERETSGSHLAKYHTFAEEDGQRISTGVIGPEDVPPATVNGEMRNDFAQNGSLWVRAEDFWACVGWAFNCSVLRFRQQPGNIYESRWERWQSWLEFMLDLMEEDWSIREVKSDPDDEILTQSVKERLQGSLIYKYIVSASGDYGRDRRMIRAIFADGSAKSMNEFKEVFKNELKEPKGDSTVDDLKAVESQPRVNIEQEIYGDYLGNSEDEDEEDDVNAADVKTTKTRPKRQRETREHVNNSDPHVSSGGLTGPSLFGSHPSLILRLRLMSLLLTVSLQLGTERTSTWTRTAILSATDLTDLLTEFTKFLPLPIFSSMLSPTFVLPHFELDYYTTLCENLLFRLLEPSAPDTDKMFLTQKKLEQCFLPFAANGNGALENAKVSLVLEGLMRAMLSGEKGEYLKWRSDLGRAAEEGIARREAKVKRRERTEAEEAWLVLVESGQRIRDVVQRLKLESE